MHRDPEPLISLGEIKMALTNTDRDEIRSIVWGELVRVGAVEQDPDRDDIPAPPPDGVAFEGLPSVSEARQFWAFRAWSLHDILRKRFR